MITVTITPAYTTEVSEREVVLTGMVAPIGYAGGGGSGSGETIPTDFVKNETPAGAVNGSNATFTTLYSFVPESVEVFIQGIKQKIITHYNTSGNTTITLSDSPLTGELILVNYIKL